MLTFHLTVRVLAKIISGHLTRFFRLIILVKLHIDWITNITDWFESNMFFVESSIIPRIGSSSAEFCSKFWARYR